MDGPGTEWPRCGEVAARRCALAPGKAEELMTTDIGNARLSLPLRRRADVCSVISLKDQGNKFQLLEIIIQDGWAGFIGRVFLSPD